jgi:outer membrane protein TolC
MMDLRKLLLSLIGCAMPLYAQESGVRVPVRMVLDLVAQNHPAQRQAALMLKAADLNLLKARGSFDPKYFLENNNKQFEGKNYYDVLHTGLKVPTWFGLEGQLGYEQAMGTNLDPMLEVPANGLTYAGLSMPLLRGLITDQRRTALAMAKVQVQSTVFERQQFLNDLGADVLRAYVRWYGADLEQELYAAATTAGELRLRQIRQTVQAGARALIDTLENDVLRRNFTISRDAAAAKALKGALELSVFLWNKEGAPLEMQTGARPSIMGLDVLDSMALSWNLNRMNRDVMQVQPLLLEQNAELNLYALERKLKQQQLLPELNLKYNFLTAGSFRPNPPGVPYWSNYRWGVTAQTSIFLRKERADAQLAQVKLEQAGIKLRLKTLETARKLEAYWNMYTTYSNLVAQYAQVVAGYQALLDAELTKLEAGESTLFLVNTREIRLLESRLKLVDYQVAKYHAALDYLRETGQLWRFFP